MCSRLMILILIMILRILRLMILIGQQPVTDSGIPSAAEEAEPGFCSLASDRSSLLPATKKIFWICWNFKISFLKNLQRIFKDTGFCSLASVLPYCNKGRRRKRDNVLALCGLFLTSRNGLKLVQGHFFNRKVMSN